MIRTAKKLAACVLMLGVLVCGWGSLFLDT